MLYVQVVSNNKGHQRSEGTLRDKLDEQETPDSRWGWNDEDDDDNVGVDLM